MSKPGPKIPEIDPHEVYKLAQIGCKTTEIAAFFKVSTDTIDRRFAEELAKGRSELQMSLRRKQIQVALGGNVSMLIWLGKQMLEQKDKHEMSSDEEKGFVMHIKDYIDKNK